MFIPDLVLSYWNLHVMSHFVLIQALETAELQSGEYAHHRPRVAPALVSKHRRHLTGVADFFAFMVARREQLGPIFTG